MITPWLVLAALLLSQQQSAPRETCRAAVTAQGAPSRAGSANFFDQGRESVAAMHPRHRLLAERRAARFGRVEYSLLAYQAEPSAPASISSLAVDWDVRRMWLIESTCPIDAWPGGLIDAIRALGALPDQKPLAADEAVIESLRATTAREIDPELPSTSFEAWLAAIVGSEVRIEWETNDCGEQTGNPALDRGRVFPRCVQVLARPQGGRGFILLFSAGPQQGRPAGPPGYHFGVITLPNGDHVEVRRLRDLPAAVKARLQRTAPERPSNESRR